MKSENMMRPIYKIGRTRSVISLVAFLVSATSLQAAIIKPNGANASSEFGGGFEAVNTINGSGLTGLGINITQAHADYNAGNHWTTSPVQSPLDQWIEWTFSSPTTIGAAYFWNHRSNVIANYPGYEPTVFDLTVFDASNNVLLTLNDFALAPDTAFAQRIDFSLLNNVSRIRFDVEAIQSFSPYTGLAEVAFDTQSFVSGAVPEPSSWAMMLAGFAGIGYALRRRKGQFSLALAK